MSIASFFHGIGSWLEKKSAGSDAGSIAHASWGGLAIWGLVGFIVFMVYASLQHLLSEPVLHMSLMAFLGWLALHGLQVLCSTAIRVFEVWCAYRDGSADENDTKILTGASPAGDTGTPGKTP